MTVTGWLWTLWSHKLLQNKESNSLRNMTWIPFPRSINNYIIGTHLVECVLKTWHPNRTGKHCRRKSMCRLYSTNSIYYKIRSVCTYGINVGITVTFNYWRIWVERNGNIWCPRWLTKFRHARRQVRIVKIGRWVCRYNVWIQPIIHKGSSTGRQEKGTIFKGVESIIWMYRVRLAVVQSIQGYSGKGMFCIESLWQVYCK